MAHIYSQPLLIWAGGLVGWYMPVGWWGGWACTAVGLYWYCTGTVQGQPMAGLVLWAGGLVGWAGPMGWWAGGLAGPSWA